MDQITHSLKSVVVLTAALLAGCSLFRSSPSEAPASASAGPSPSQAPGAAQPPGAQPPSPAQHPPPVRTHHLSAASRSLVDQAHAQIAHGDLPGASSSLDRALRIETSNPLLWIEMGRLRLAENDAHQAENCARKALALASSDHAAQAESGRLLADALRAQHRNQDALEVEREYVK